MFFLINKIIHISVPMVNLKALLYFLQIKLFPIKIFKDMQKILLDKLKHDIAKLYDLFTNIVKSVKYYI